MSTHYRHLVLADRIEIEKLVDQGFTQSAIAEQIGVHRSTISREIRRRSWQPEHSHANLRPYLRNKLDTRMPRSRLYLAGQAQVHADNRAKLSHQPYRLNNDQLVDWILSHLRKGWTPEEICGRLRSEFPNSLRMRLSPETFYSWIYSPRQKHRQLWQYLPRGHKRRRRMSGRRVHSDRIKFRVSIHDRPEAVESREEFGHWESDSVLGLRGSGALHTTVERTSRYLVAVKIPAVDASSTLQAQKIVYSSLPKHSVKTVTVDNGKEFSFHYKLKAESGIPTYFADPYSAYQRGTNEHFNGRIRKYLPKGTSFDDISQEEIDEIVQEINNRPRKVLGWATPAEVFQELTLS